MDRPLSSLPSSEELACPRMEIDLRVIQEIHHRSPDPTMYQPLLQEYPKQEWSLSRNEVPYSLAQKGFTINDWTNIFDEASALWEKRAIALREVKEQPLKLSPAVSAVIFTVIFEYLLGFIYFFGWVNTWTNLVFLWLLFLWLICFLPFLFVTVMFTTGYGESLSMYSGQLFATLEECEGTWSRLGNEQTCDYQSFGVEVVPIKEVTKTRGRCHVWTVGLRLRFDMPYSNDEEDCWAMSNGPASVAAVQDLDRLLQLNQSGDIEIQGYQLLKSRILLKMSLPFQYASRPETSHDPRSDATIAVMTCSQNWCMW